MSARDRSPVVMLAGHAYAPLLVSTIEHDFWLMSHIRAARLDALTKAEDESAEEFVSRILHEVIDSGSAFELLGGMLIPANVPVEQWTPERANETAAFIRKLTDPEDKAKVQAQLISLLIGFFESGLSSLTISLSSSGDMEKQPGTVAA